MKTFQTFIFSALWVSMLLYPLWAQNDRNVSPVQGPGDTSERKTALVIGNGAYAESPLPNPVNDAADMAGALRGLGFEVVLLKNADIAKMKSAIMDFGEKLGRGGVGLFYYAGHGLQVKGNNYLVPIGAAIKKEAQVEYEAVDAGRVLAEMTEARNRLNIVILDACRNNPYERSFRSGGGRGLATLDAPAGTLIAYATAPGRVAEDGEGRNSPYTAALLAQVRVPELKIEDLFKRVRAAVMQKTNNAQVPWESTSITGDFYFIPPAEPETPPVEHTPTITSGEKRPPGITGLEFISGGEFRMGDTFGEGEDNEKPAHTVTVSDFYMSKYEVSVADFRKFVNAAGYKTDAEKGGGAYTWEGGKWVHKADINWRNPSFSQSENHPVVCVSWYDAVEYCNWRSRQEGLTPCYRIDKTRKDPNNTNSYDDKKWLVSCDFSANGYRLPTEAEWEYAAREGGKKVRFGNGKDIADPAEINFAGSADYKKSYSVAGVYRRQTVAVGTFSPNRLELYDMSGNVLEWCWDWYGDYSSGSQKDPKGGSYRVLRGGSWNYYPDGARAANRSYFKPNNAIYDGGFRLARTP